MAEEQRIGVCALKRKRGYTDVNPGLFSEAGLRNWKVFTAFPGEHSHTLLLATDHQFGDNNARHSVPRIRPRR